MATKTAGIDQDALITMFAEASAKQGEALRQAVSQVTLRALQGRELTLSNIRSVVKSVTEAASQGAAKNVLPGVDIEALLGRAFEGMDAALLQAVEANRRALQQFLDQGVDLQQGRLQTAMTELEKMEDMLFAAVGKAAQGTAMPVVQGPWTQVLESMKLKGTGTGAQASAAVEQLMAQTRDALRGSRNFSLRAAQAMMDSYAAIASGVLIGMSDGLQQGGSVASEAPARKRR